MKEEWKVSLQANAERKNWAKKGNIEEEIPLLFQYFHI
jgi:hypothetical protein